MIDLMVIATVRVIWRVIIPKPFRRLRNKPAAPETLEKTRIFFRGATGCGQIGIKEASRPAGRGAGATQPAGLRASVIGA